MNKSVSKTIENEAKEQKGQFHSLFMAILGTSLLVNMIADKTKIPEQRVIRPGEGTIRAGHDF